MTVYIKTGIDNWTRSNFALSEEGFRRLGRSIVRYEDIDHVTFESGDIVHGTCSDFRTLYPDFPCIDFPEPLREFGGRAIESTSLSEVRKLVSNEKSIFVKPRGHHKAFTGRVVTKPSHLSDISSLDESFPVWISEPVDFDSEWRVYVREGKPVEISRYLGDPTVFPDSDMIYRMLHSWENQPSGWGLDVGVLDGETVLVEANHGFCLGAYGIEPVSYARLIDAAWSDLR